MLAEDGFRRQDETPDWLFYRQPRFVTHIDGTAVAAVTQVYRELFPPGADVLDLMSSWVSHLPPEVAYRYVFGLGMNEAELAANPRLNGYMVHDLNARPSIPLDTATFDAAAICVSIQYLTHPVEVLRDLGRVLRPGAVLAITFSNRCFPTKAVAIWQSVGDTGHGALITEYLRQAGTWIDIDVQDRSPGRPGEDPLYAVIARTAT
ncbi:MAG: methyltransferase domain-containing protein [Chloroflexi bacterium]|nr:methyltransferase domain-containing protein [Chloroflexota bacterium]